MQILLFVLFLHKAVSYFGMVCTRQNRACPSSVDSSTNKVKSKVLLSSSRGERGRELRKSQCRTWKRFSEACE